MYSVSPNSFRIVMVDGRVCGMIRYIYWEIQFFFFLLDFYVFDRFVVRDLIWYSVFRFVSCQFCSQMWKGSKFVVMKRKKRADVKDQRRDFR